MSLLHYMISHWHVIVLDIALDEDFIEQSDMDSQQTRFVFYNLSFCGLLLMISDSVAMKDCLPYYIIVFLL